MSNIVLKGDVIQNIGEYLPNPYIEKINVTDESGEVSLEIDYSLMFMISDEYDVQDLIAQLEGLHLFAFCRKSDKVLDKKSAIEKYINRGPYGTQIYSSEDALINGIITNINAENYDDNLYDPDDRQIIKVTSTAIINEIPSEDIRDESFYLYMFTSVLSDSEITTPFGFKMGYLNTSNVAYEKVFSPNLRIVKEELPVYLTNDSTKYGQTPLLGLDRNYYQNRTVSREQIISKVRSLIARFDGSSNTALQENINNIKSILSDKGESEDLLAELDKVRRGFTSKTNNNPVGNLYAAYSILLQNMNSSFPRTEMLTKQKYTTGKVFDLRTSNLGIPLSTSTTTTGEYITNPTLSRRISETTNNETISGVFFVNLEQLAKDKAKFFDYTTPDRFYEVATAVNLPSLKAALFSYFKADKLEVKLSAQEPGLRIELLTLTKQYQDKYASATEELAGGSNALYSWLLAEPYYYFNEQQINVMSYGYVSYGNEILIPDEIITFEYDIKFNYVDTSYELFFLLVDKYNYWKEKYIEYVTQAQQICSYNNITNNFNNFFSKSVKAYWDAEGIGYPWEMMPTMYAIMSYLTTDAFSTFEEASEYARSVAHNISPDTGNLGFVETEFKSIVEGFADLLGDLSSGRYTGGGFSPISDSITKIHTISAPQDAVAVETPSGEIDTDSAEDATSTDSASTDPAEAAAVVASVIGGGLIENAFLEGGLSYDKTTDQLRKV